ncbi:ion transporter [Streptomyces sp. YIM 98790]|uniref:ion transporter n=1 Tax=Streptomyces sp. YIM 98790 TaxID=2689077 RepID=UPI001A9F2DFF|nr:ion transporter [Streptomyces sp. YIM 98790]
MSQPWPPRLPSSPEDRERFADQLLDRLTPVMSALGVIFLLVVIGERMARAGSPAALALAVAGWLLWALFIAEFALRLYAAPRRKRFLRRHWWQLIFLALPFLRVLRLVRSVRLLRSGRVLSTAVRTSRSAARLLGDRLTWLALVTVMVVLLSAELLHEFRVYDSFATALHAAALAAISGTPMDSPDPYARVMEIILALYSVIVFATLAASLGAYFLNARTGAPPPSGTYGSSPRTPRSRD